MRTQPDTPVSYTPDAPYDAVLVVSFGGPEGMDDVMPFLNNVLAGRNVPEKRKEEAAHHYALFDGVSPLNAQNRQLISALRSELERRGLALPIYWGNRNWHPYLADTMRQMANDGVRHALAFITSAYSSYSGCRQYLENIAAARAAVGPSAPTVSVMRKFFNHPGFIEPTREQLQKALGQIPNERRPAAHVAFTAHSIPVAMANASAYQAQLSETCRLVAEDISNPWHLVYQSRSGSPHQPWLEPDICDHLRRLSAEGIRDVVIAPVGFISDHIEVLYDLDTEARACSRDQDINMVRAATVGTNPAFVSMIGELIAERMRPETPKRWLGGMGPGHDSCPEGCCLPQ
ncbi:MAG: ferrochelatase [Ktedonobacterales bacterium]